MRFHPKLVWLDSSIRFLKSDNFTHTKAQLLSSGGILHLVRSGHNIFSATHEDLYKFFPTNIEHTKQTGTPLNATSFSSFCGFFFQCSSNLQNEWLCWIIFFRNDRCRRTHCVQNWKNLQTHFPILCAVCSPRQVHPANDHHTMQLEIASTKTIFRRQVPVLVCDPEKQNHCVTPPLLNVDWFSGCHRFDQSALSVLLGNTFNFNNSIYLDHMAKTDLGTFVKVTRGKYRKRPLKYCSGTKVWRVQAPANRSAAPNRLQPIGAPHPTGSSQ